MEGGRGVASSTAGVAAGITGGGRLGGVGPPRVCPRPAPPTPLTPRTPSLGVEEVESTGSRLGGALVAGSSAGAAAEASLGSSTGSACAGAGGHTGCSSVGRGVEGEGGRRWEEGVAGAGGGPLG